MKIRLTTDTGALFAEVTTWSEANTAARAVFKRNNWSDLYYFIEFDTKQETSGSIDLEPYSFHARQQREIFTTHLKTFWSNIKALERNKAKIYGISEDDQKFCAYLLTELPND
jgi:hypothetical protein